MCESSAVEATSKGSYNQEKDECSAGMMAKREMKRDVSGKPVRSTLPRILKLDFNFDDWQ